MRCRRLTIAARAAACSGACDSAIATAVFIGTANRPARISSKRSIGPGLRWVTLMTKESLLAAVRRNAYAIRVEASLPFHSRSTSSAATCRCGRHFVSRQRSARPATCRTDRDATAMAHHRHQRRRGLHAVSSAVFRRKRTGRRWHYRVRAKNGSGVSEPSNIGGPVKVKNATLEEGTRLSEF